MKLLNDYHLDVDYTVTDNFKHKDLDLYNNQTKENCFYLIPINSGSSSGKNKNNMHWICYEKCGENLFIFNSSENKTERNARTNAKLPGRKVISNTSDLLKV